MLHPVGQRPPSVYWFRRGILLALVLLIGVSVYAIFFRGGGTAEPARTSTPPSTHSSPPSSSASATHSSSSSAAASRATRTSPATPIACVASQLGVAAATSATSYPAGAKPVLALVVTNTGPAPCVQDLADSQIELRVYNGSARVWGSHDCAIQPGVSKVVLPVGQPIRREIEWSGLTSRPGCAGTRVRVGAGTYTLQAFLSGQQGSSAQFSLAG